MNKNLIAVMFIFSFIFSLAAVLSGCEDKKTDGGDVDALEQEAAEEATAEETEPEELAAAEEEELAEAVEIAQEETADETEFDPRAVKIGDPCSQTGVTICSKTEQCACFGFKCQPNGLWRYDTLIMDGGCIPIYCDYLIFEPLADGDVEYEYICG